MPSFLRPVWQAFVSMVVSYALSRHVTPLFPLSGFALRDHSQKMALSPSFSYAEARNREERKGDRLLRAFIFSSLQPPSNRKRASAAEERDNGLLRKTDSHRVVLLRTFTPQK